MGAISVRQPLPTQQVEQVDPFILLHHFGPTTAEPGFDPLDLGPHPHRGFEPVTFLYQGALRHRDSRGNTGHLQAGDVQWMTAGMGIIHSERAHQDFVEQGGTLEGIQLWVNLPKRHKMVQPRYQDIKQAQIPLVAMPDPQARKLPCPCPLTGMRSSTCCGGKYSSTTTGTMVPKRCLPSGRMVRASNSGVRRNTARYYCWLVSRSTSPLRSGDLL